jgi:hypothetical protein
MVVEIRLMLQLVEEIKESVRVDVDTSSLQECLCSLEAIGILSMYAREWIGNPKELLEELCTQLKKVSEEISNWQKRAQEVIQMI